MTSYHRGVGNVYGDNDAQPLGVGIETLKQAMRLFSEPLETKLDTLIGVFERHKAERYINQILSISAAQVAGIGTYPTQILDTTLSFFAWSFIVNNISNYTLYEASTHSYIPPNQLNFVVRGATATSHIQLFVIAGTDVAGHNIDITATEERLTPGTGDIDTSGGGVASSVTVADGTVGSQKLAVDNTGKIGVNNFPAATIIRDATNAAFQATVDSGGRLQAILFGTSPVDVRGAANAAASAVSVPTTAGGIQLLAARATRQSALIVNNDATNPIYIVYGAQTPTAALGTPLFAKASVVIQNQLAVSAIATGGAVDTRITEEWT